MSDSSSESTIGLHSKPGGSLLTVSHHVCKSASLQPDSDPSVVFQRERKREGDHDPDLGPPPKKANWPPSETETLCADCRMIDFPKILKVELKDLYSHNNSGIFIAELGTRCNSVPTNGCTFCNFFFQHRCWPTNDCEQKYQLRVFSYLRSSRTIDNTAINNTERLLHDAPCLGIVAKGRTFKAEFERTGHIFLLHERLQYKESYFAPSALQSHVDFKLAKSWLEHCLKDHKSCQEDTTEIGVLKLIDCNSEIPEVIPAPKDAQYIALSYVWGSPQQGTEIQDFNMSPGNSSFSRTVRDAITATKQLGVQYLWVDKHCIDQNDAQEKHHQISRMDTIYRGAYATIIASSGENANCGLPGVGNTYREKQPMVRYGDFALVSTMRHPHNSIPSSPWSARAWTLQESVLSRRRLVFTENQLYFECDRMNCTESLPPQVNLIHRKPDLVYRYFHSGVLGGRVGNSFNVGYERPTNRQKQIQRYEELLCDYKKRTLSYHTDAYNAFAGIDRHLSRAQDHPRIWTILYLSVHQFVLDLCWWHHFDSKTPPKQCWDPKSKSSDSTELYIPSWSHIGWRGDIVNDSYRNPTNIQSISLELNVNNETIIEPIQSCISSFGKIKASLPMALHFEVPVLEAKLFIFDPLSNVVTFRGGLVVWRLSENWGTEMMERLWSRIVGGEVELLCLHDWSKFAECLVTEKHESYSSRIGTAVVDLYVRKNLEPVILSNLMQKIRLR